MNPRPFRVLIVDDSEADARAFTRMLKQQFDERARVEHAETGAAAMQLVRQEAVEVALIDYRLADMDGLQVLEEILTLRKRTAAIMLTGLGNERIAAEAIKQGARDYLVKGDVTAPVLRRVITQAVEHTRLEVQGGHSVQQLLRTHHDLDHFVKSLSHDMSANFMMLENSVKQLKRRCDGHQAPELIEGVSHVEACLVESKLFLQDLATLATTGRVGMEPERVEVAEIVQEVLYEFDALFAERGAKMTVDAKLPVMWCNRTRLRQVLVNLLRNAALHGCDRHDPRITISSPTRPARRLAPRQAWLRIHDNGPGIPAAFREEIFLAGQRLPATKSPGSGMGLAIVKQIVDYYGGTISVEPDCPDGTAFLLSLPTPADAP